MNELDLIRRHAVSPKYLAKIRTIFTQREYLSPRIYKNNSRYKNLRRLEGEEGKLYHENWIKKYVDESAEDQFMTVTLDDENRLDIISNKYYGTPRYWWVIALANEIIDPFDIPIGTYLRIPSLISLYNTGGVLSSD